MEPVLTTVIAIAGAVLLRSAHVLVKDWLQNWPRFAKALDKIQLTVTKQDGSKEKVEVSMKEQMSEENIKKIIAVLKEAGDGAKPPQK